MLKTTSVAYLLRLLTVIGLGMSVFACSMMPEPVEPTVEISENDVAEPEAEQSPEELQAITLRLNPNQYQLSKKGFSAAQQQSFNAALKLVENGNFKEAEAQLSALQQTPEGPSAIWVLSGDVANQQGNQQEASALYQTALSVNPFNYYALNRLGLMYRENGQFEKAMKAYQQAIDAWPGYAVSYYNAGILNDLYLGNKARAIEAYQQYLTLIEHPASGDPDKKHIKQIERWIGDVSRQQKAAMKEPTE